MVGRGGIEGSKYECRGGTLKLYSGHLLGFWFYYIGKKVRELPFRYYFLFLDHLDAVASKGIEVDWPKVICASRNGTKICGRLLWVLYR